jgi:hypothetical protein
MSNPSHRTGLGWRPHGLGPSFAAQGYLGADQEAAEQAAVAAPARTVDEILKAQGIALARIQKSSEETLLFRKIATGATIAGALFAMIRLSDIYFAVKARKATR